MAMNSLSVLGGNFATKGELDLAGGLVHINTTTFSAVSSVSVNNCFTSSYENYQIVVNSVMSTTVDVYLRMRTSGTDKTTNYQWGRMYVGVQDTTGLAGGSETNGSLWIIGATSTGSGLTYGANINLMSPQISGRYTAGNVLSTARLFHPTGLLQGTTDSFDGLTFYPSSGTTTGTISVYGYKNGA